MTLEMFELQLFNVGQCPSQIWKKKHPQRQKILQPKAPLVEEIQSQQTNSLQVVVNDLTVVCYKELMTITFQRSNLKETFSDFGFTGIELSIHCF